jgi:Bacteriophage tail sheath protein
MPAQLTYPGIYIEEVPSGVRTITGVATSITALVGRAARGPVNDPITLTSFADFERRFGGLWRLSSLGFAVRDFFQNGGNQAIVVRLYREGPGAPTATIDANGLALRAASPGSWGNALRARVELGADGYVSPDLADQWHNEFPDIATTDLLNLIVRDTATGATEEYRNVTVEDSPRQLETILENQSRLVVIDGTPAFPSASHGAPGPGADIWADDALSSPVDQEGSDGLELDEGSFTGPGTEDAKEGLYALNTADLFNLLCIPPYDDGDVDESLVGDAATYCERRRAMLIVDARSDWDSVEDARDNVGSVGTDSRNAALFFPRIRRPNPLFVDQVDDFAASGAVAGIFARTDAQRGVWKAPAGQDATIVGAPALSAQLTDGDIGQLNPLGINCLRTLPAAGRVVWGSRTLQGNDRLASEWKYIPVRRTALFLEESLYRGTQWVVFEPNAEPLWAQIRLNVGAFMNNLFRQGAFAGTTPREAYFVKCDAETTTQDDVNLGVVNIAVGFAPLKPAEFVVIRIQQMAGQAGGA